MIRLADLPNERAAAPHWCAQPLACLGTLPEEVVDHVFHFARVDIYQDRIVIIPYPSIRTINLRQAVIAWIADLVILPEKQIFEEKTDRQAAIAVVPVGRIVGAQLVIR